MILEKKNAEESNYVKIMSAKKQVGGYRVTYIIILKVLSSTFIDPIICLFINLSMVLYSKRLFPFLGQHYQINDHPDRV